jgi:uncharacterized Rmd1/YagE family protein
MRPQHLFEVSAEFRITKNLATQKLDTAGDLYRFMVDQFNQSRAFLLELAVVIILVIELIFLFRGRPF